MEDLQSSLSFGRSSAYQTGPKFLIFYPSLMFMLVCFGSLFQSRVTIVVAYLMKTRRTSLSQALEHVKSRRPVASPNSGFIRQLEDFEKSLQGSWGKRKIGEGSGQSKRQKLMPASKIIAGASKERAAAALSEMKGYSVDSVLNELLELEEVMRTFEAVV